MAVDNEEELVFPAYSGLDRVATIAGVPLIPGLIVFCACSMTGLIGGLVLGPGGFLLAATGVPLLLWFKVVCETDDQALHIVWLEILCAIDRRNAAWFGGTYTLSPAHYGRRKRDVKAGGERYSAPGFPADESEEEDDTLESESPERRL